MKTLEDFDFGRQVSRSTYDWDAILDGDIHLLEEGKDYTCKSQTMAQRLRQVAKKMELGVRVSKTKQGLVCQAYQRDDDEFEAAKSEANSKSEEEEKPRRRRRKSA